MPRSTLLLLPIISLLMASKPKDTQTLRVTHLLTFVGQIREKGQQYVLVKSTLLNNTNDTLQFITMNCSYTDGFLLDTKQLSIETPICFKNSWYYQKIAPHQQFSRSLRLIVKGMPTAGKEILGRSNFKLGFNFIEQESTLEKINDKTGVKKALSEFDKVTNMKNVIWSNPIDMTNPSNINR